MWQRVSQPSMAWMNSRSRRQLLRNRLRQTLRAMEHMQRNESFHLYPTWCTVRAAASVKLGLVFAAWCPWNRTEAKQMR